MTDELFNAFIKINQLSAHSAGEAARLLASRTRYLKNLIKEYYKKNGNNLSFQQLLATYVELVSIEVTKKESNHMIHDSINFIERLINDKTKK